MTQAPLSPISELVKRTSSKWRRYAPDVLPMHVAEMDYEIAENIKALLIDAVQHSDLGYLGPIPEVGQAFAGFALRHWGWHVDPKQVRIFTDVGVGCVEIMRGLGEPGDKVLISSPVYSSFYGWIAELEMTMVDAPLKLDEDGWQLDLAEVEAQFKSGVKFYLICSPQNPVGKIFSKAELIAIADLAKKYEVIVISDEIHAPLTFEGNLFAPFLSVSDAAREVGVCVTAASKSFNLAGLKAAIAVTDNAEMHKKLRAVPEAWHWRSSILGARAMAEAFETCDQWLHDANVANQKSRDLLTALVAEHLPGIPYWIPDAGYLAWLDLRSLELGSNPAQKILEEQKVAFVPGVDLGANYPQYIRINFACHPKSLERAISAIANYRK